MDGKVSGKAKEKDLKKKKPQKDVHFKSNVMKNTRHQSNLFWFLPRNYRRMFAIL